MNLYTLFQLVLALMDASILDEVKSHEIVTDDRKHLIKIVFESAKVRVTIEKLNNTITFQGTTITNVIGGSVITNWAPFVIAPDLQ